jgi:hypothetical protein
LQPFRLQRGIPDRLAPERIESCGEVAVRAQRLDERHRGRDAAEQLFVGSPGRGLRCRRRRRRSCGLARRRRFGMAVRLAQVLQQASETRQRLEQVTVPALEEGAPLGRDRLGVVEVLLEQGSRVTGIDSVDVRHRHPCLL